MARAVRKIKPETNDIGNGNSEIDGSIDAREQLDASASEPINELDGSIDENAASVEAHSATEAREPETDAPKGKRGRPKLTDEQKAERELKSTKKEKLDIGAKPSSKSISNVAGLYQVANNLIAMRAKAPEFVINEVEAKSVAEPLAVVLKQWGINLDGADNPYLTLVGVIIGVYGQRVMVYRSRKASERQSNVSDTRANPVYTPNASGQPQPIRYS